MNERKLHIPHPFNHTYPVFQVIIGNQCGSQTPWSREEIIKKKIMMYKKLCIFSYNSRGFNSSKQEFLKALTTAGDSLPVICNQENFLLKANEYFARNALPNHHIYFNPATKENLNGRPKNGMFVVVPELLKELVKDVSPPSKRMQGLLFKFKT